jgi:hypothetical protein
MAAEIQTDGLHFERLSRYESRPPDRQATLAGVAEKLEQMLGNDELKNRVAEEFEPLIIKMRALFFMTHAGMSERFGQQLRVAKPMPDAFFEWVHNDRQGVGRGCFV